MSLGGKNINIKILFINIHDVLHNNSDYSVLKISNLNIP